MGKRAFIFPGQGSQYVGMAKDIIEKSVEAKEMVQMADDALGYNLSHIMFNGPEELLKQTENTQPAIFMHSIIISSLFRSFSSDMTAGHSLGEYSALVSANAIQFYDAVKVVRTRGLAMQNAGKVNSGTMAAVIGLNSDILNEICDEASELGVVKCANYNSPGQIVISGSVEGVKKAMEISKMRGARLVKELVVSGAFHSPLMEPAIDELREKLDTTNIFDAKIPVYANVTAKPVTKKEEIKKLLVEQLNSPVRWEETMINMINDGADEFVEIGPGNVLQGLLKRINPEIKCICIDKFTDLEKYL